MNIGRVAGSLFAACLVFAPSLVYGQSKCDRGCLLDVTRDYMEAMLSHDPSALRWADSAKFTENGKVMTPGDGIWKTAKGYPFRQALADPTTGEAALFATVAEADNQLALFFLRLKVTGGKISEAETFVGRKGIDRIFNPDGLTAVQSAFSDMVPESERSSRARLIQIADSYFEGIEKHDGKIPPFHPECARRENGVWMLHNLQRPTITTCTQNLSLQLDYIKTVRGRRFPIVDVARGLVLGVAVFDMPGPDGGARAATSLLLYELFKVESGRIGAVEAFMGTVPLGSVSGWE